MSMKSTELRALMLWHMYQRKKAGGHVRTWPPKYLELF